MMGEGKERSAWQGLRRAGHPAAYTRPTFGLFGRFKGMKREAQWLCSSLLALLIAHRSLLVAGLLLFETDATDTIRTNDAVDAMCHSKPTID